MRALGVGVLPGVTPQELEHYLELTQEIERLEAALKAAQQAKQALAQRLYERHGRGTSYKIGDKYWIVAPSRSGTYYFVPRVRWPKEARAAKAEQKRLDRIARLQRMPLRTPADTSRVHLSETPEEIRIAANLESEPPTPRRIEATATLSRARDESLKLTLDDGTPLTVRQQGGSGGVPTAPKAPPTPPLPPDADQSRRHLPLVGDVDRPTNVEPRLLQIQEPADQDD